MGFLQNILNGVTDIVKIVIIALVCLVVLFIGGYLVADVIGLIPEATGLHRSLSVQTFLTDLPFIGNNMIYLIIAMAILVIAYIAIDVYGRKQKTDSEAEPEVLKNEQTAPAGTAAEKPAEPEAPKAKP